METNKFFQSKVFSGFIGGVAGLLLILVVFKAGEVVGSRKADFSCRWGGNYHRNFGGPEGGFFMGFDDRNFIDANGTFGQIIKIDGLNYVIKGRDDMEKVILINDGTIIKRLRDTIKTSDLKVDDYIVVIGEPNDVGQIEAKFVRLMPPPPAPGQGKMSPR